MSSIPLSFPSTVYVYGLTDPRSTLIRYIGVSANPQRRLKLHLYLRHKGTTHKNRWLGELWRAGLRPSLVVLDSINTAVDDWAVIERFYIAAYRAAGFPLTNTALGGFGGLGLKRDAASRLRRSAAFVQLYKLHPELIRRGHHRTDAEKARIGTAIRARAAEAPELWPRGDRHGAHTHPERWHRGEGHHWYGHTGTAHNQGGDKNWQRCYPERVRRGEQAPAALLTWAQVAAIRTRYAARTRGGPDGPKALACEFSVAVSTIRAIVSGKTWKEGTDSAVNAETPEARKRAAAQQTPDIMERADAM